MGPGGPAVPRPVRIRSAPVYAPASAEERAERWHAAVRRGSHSAVQSCLRDGWAPVNSTDAAGFTALMRSCVSGQLLSLLLSHAGCDVNATAAADRSTALLIACRHRSARIVNQLLQRGALMTRDRAGATVLHKAAANSDPSVLRLLLQTGAAPYLRDGDGRCPLTAALLLGNQEAALVMLEEVGRCLHGRRAAQAGTAQAGPAQGVTARAGTAQPDTAQPDTAAAGAQIGSALYLGEPKLSRGCTHPAASDCQAGQPAAAASPQPVAETAAAASGVVLTAEAAGAASDASTEALTAALARFPAGGGVGDGSTYSAICARVDILPDETLDMIVAAAVASSAPGARDGIACGSAPAEGASGSAGGGVGVAGGAVGLLPGGEQAVWAGMTSSRIPAGVHGPARLHSVDGRDGGLATEDAAAAVLRVLSGTCSRFRAACRRFELHRWTSRESLSAPVMRYHPRWQHTTLLHLAAAQGMEEVAVRLMQRGSRVDAVDSCGRTPLEEARLKNQPMMVALLLSCERQRREDATRGHAERLTTRPPRADARVMAG